MAERKKWLFLIKKISEATDQSSRSKLGLQTLSSQ